MNDKLEYWRKQIDALDDQLLNILKKRTDIVIRIGNYKKTHALSLLDETRWKKVLESRLRIAEKKNISGKFIEKLYNLIHEYSLYLERKS
jgi:chorismate mutase